MTDESVKAVVDRFEGEKAVLELEGRRQLVVARDQLPQQTREGHHLHVTLKDNQIVEAMIDEGASETAHLRIREKLRRLLRGEHLDH